MLLIFLFKPLPWHIQTIGQLLNFEIVKDLKSIRFLSLEMYFAILDNV